VEEKKDKTFYPSGIDVLKDKADVKNKLNKFLPNQFEYDILDFSYQASEYQELSGNKFQIILVEYRPEYIPFISQADGGDNDIRKNAIYTRRGTCSEEVNYEELQKIINNRVATGYSSRNELNLAQHLSELKVLYSNLPNLSDTITSIAAIYGRSQMQEFFKFISIQIEAKKAIIQSFIIGNR